MQRKPWRASSFGLFALCTLSWTAGVSAQGPAPVGQFPPRASMAVSHPGRDLNTDRSAFVPTNPAIIKGYLEEGAHIEADRRWQEAMHFYEKCFRLHRDAKELEYRLKICRIHHDVVRRYGDATFTQALDTLSGQAALELYSEVLGKLELNYVEATSLQDLMRNGTAYLEVALTEPDFIKRNASQATPAEIEHFRANIHKVVIQRNIRSRNEARSVLWQVATDASQTLGIPMTATIHEYIAGAVGLLDPYSGFMTAGELADVMSQINGNLIGLGIELWAEKDELRIVEVFPGSPAALAGLAEGDEILQVGDILITDVGAKKGADLLRGPENSRVQLLVRRDNMAPNEVSVTRRKVDVPSVVTSELVEPTRGVGYIRISNFQKTTTEEVDRSMLQLSQQGMKSLIIDLRRNPGGLLEASVELADRFLKQGAIVTTRGRNGIENRNYLAHEPQTWDIPLIVLIDSDSASASEIFAGAIRDHRRGILIGQTSYGKGSVQGLFQTDSAAGGLRLTVSKFFSPLGHPISTFGVQPDIAIQKEDSGTGSHSVAKPRMGNDGAKLIDSKRRENDHALRRAIQVAIDPSHAIQ